MSGKPRVTQGALLLAAVLLVGVVALVVVASRGPDGPRSLDDRVRSVASTLRCPVCQNLSVADSPSRLAQEMRATIGRELQAGRSPAEIRAGFVASYGEWILLAPPKHGIDLIAWLGPLALLLGALAAGLVALRRWTAARRALGPAAAEEGWAHPLAPSDRRLLEAALHASGEDVD